MAEIAYRKTLEFDGPIGLTWRRIVNLIQHANPIIYFLQCQLLAILSFLDDQILVFQKTIEKVFPPSSHLFVKNDDLVLLIMSLPEKFNVALNKFPEIIHQIPGFDFVLKYLNWWLNCLVSILSKCGLNKGIKLISTSDLCEVQSKSDATKVVATNEGSSYKEALMNNDDVDEGDVNNASVNQKMSSYMEALILNDDGDEGDVNACANQERGSCKEALLRNDKDEVENDEAGRNGRVKEDNDDDIMGMFESRWAQ